MKISDFYRPQRVWVNAPSTLQQDHRYHGRVGIAVKCAGSDKYVELFFTEGLVLSVLVDPASLDRKLTR